MNNPSGVILFDGVCNLCNHAVEFVIKRDQKRFYSFASIQSQQGQELMREYQVSEDIDSMIVIEGKRAFTHDQAALKIVGKLPVWWRVFYIAYIIPPSWRKLLYKKVANNRYRLFGKKESCRLPTQEEKDRFL